MLVGSKVNYDISNLYMPKDVKGDNDYQKSFIATLTIIVRDKDGKVIKKYKQKSHSPTANFIGMMLPMTWFKETGNSWTFTSTSNSTSSIKPNGTTSNGSIPYPNSGYNNTIYIVNILVGSGSQSNSYNAINLNAPISNGSGTGQLIYSTLSTPTNITVNGNEAYFIISQSYTNQSSSTINITEVGIILYLITAAADAYSASTSSVIGNTLTWYDVLSSPISVGSGQSATIYYTFSVNA